MRAVDLARKIKQNRARLRSVEVVVHRFLEPHRERMPPIDLNRRWRRIAQRGVQPRETGASVLQVLVRVVERATIVGTQNEKADHLGLPDLLEDISQPEEIAERLG